jgi:hypothetical protein
LRRPAQDLPGKVLIALRAGPAGWAGKSVTFSLTSVTDFVTDTRLAHRRTPSRGHFRKRSESGARGRICNPLPGGFGHHLTGITTGPGGAFPGLGQAGAGNARLETQGLRPPVGAGLQDRASRHVPGSLAWSCAQRAKAPTARAVVERRQASASRWTRAASVDADGRITRLSAFRFLFLLSL